MPLLSDIQCHKMSSVLSSAWGFYTDFNLLKVISYSTDWMQALENQEVVLIKKHILHNSIIIWFYTNTWN